MKNALYILQKAPAGPKRRRTVKQIKPVALAVIELRLSEGSSQSVSYLPTQSVSKNSINYFVAHAYSFVVPTIQLLSYYMIVACTKTCISGCLHYNKECL